MSNIKKQYYRNSLRLEDYDYSQNGYYYITICTKEKISLFGHIENNKIQLNKYGKVAESELIKSAEIRDEIKIDYYVVMPNHIHFIVIIDSIHNKDINDKRANGRSPLRMSSKSISSFISGFKSIVTKRINIIRHMPGTPVWQRNYYEHVIRNEKELFELRKYIKENPLKWELDEDNPDNFKEGERPFAPTKKK